MKRILVGGIGNIFLGDDGFGSEVARRLAQRPQPDGVRVVDFGIRGLDLVYALLDPYEAVILVDLVARGGAAGSLYLMQAEVGEEAPVSLEAHGLDPVKVLAVARSLGGGSAPTYLVGCEPETVTDPDSGDVEMGFSPRVAAAVDGAVEMVEAELARLLAGGAADRSRHNAGGRTAG